MEKGGKFVNCDELCLFPRSCHYEHCIFFKTVIFFFLLAWVSSLAVSTYYLFFPLGAVLSERYGCWVVALLGTLFCSAGLLSSSFVTSLPLLYLTYSLMWGLGASFVYFADLLILTKYFKERLAFANGIMALGGAIGGSVLNPTMQQLFIHLGLANMFRVLSGAFLLLSGFSLVYRPRPIVCPRNSDVTKEKGEKKCMFDWEILRNKAFIMWITVIFIFMLGYMVPFVHLVSYHKMPVLASFLPTSSLGLSPFSKWRDKAAKMVVT